MEAEVDRGAARPVGALERWKRTWWVAFASVPFGWLAFVPFVVAGRGARRRDWIGWSIAHFAGIWGATVVASVEELDYGIRQAGAMVMLVWWVAAFVHAMAIRGPYLDAAPRRGDDAGAVPAGVPPVVPAARPDYASRPLPDPKEWAEATVARHSGPWGRSWVESRAGRVVFLVIAALMVVGGVAMTLDGQPAGPATGVFGLALLAAISLLFAQRPAGAPVATAVEGSAEAGLVFAHSPARQRSGVAICGLMGLSFALMWLTPGVFDEDDVLIRFVAPAGAVMFGLFFLMGLRGMGKGKGFLALTSRGIVVRQGGSRTFVPWEAVTEVRAAALRARYGSQEPFIAVDVSDRNLVETTGAGRFFMRLNPRSFGDVSLAARLFDVEPALVLATMRHYAAHPEDRRELGTPESVAVFEDLRLRGA